MKWVLTHFRKKINYVVSILQHMHITGKLGLARQDVHLSVYAISNAQH